MEGAIASTGSGTPAIWNVKDDDTNIDILGTVHILKPELNWITPEIGSIIDNAQIIVIETDLESPEATNEISKLMLDKGLFYDGQSLTSVMRDQDKADFLNYLKNNKIPLSIIEDFKPWYAAITISLEQIATAGYDLNSGVEKVILKRVKANKVDLAYLETAKDQLGILGDMEMEQQIEFLMSSVHIGEKGVKMFDLLVSEWAEGDTKGLALLMSNETMMSEAVYDAFLINRNKKWVPQIKSMLEEKKGNILIAVGAAHLVGKDSVISLLRDEGYKVSGP